MEKTVETNAALSVSLIILNMCVTKAMELVRMVVLMDSGVSLVTRLVVKAVTALLVIYIMGHA